MACALVYNPRIFSNSSLSVCLKLQMCCFGISSFHL